MGASQSRLPPLRLRACGAAKGHGLGGFAGRNQVPVQCTPGSGGTAVRGQSERRERLAMHSLPLWLPNDRHVEMFYSIL